MGEMVWIDSSSHSRSARTLSLLISAEKLVVGKSFEDRLQGIGQRSNVCTLLSKSIACATVCESKKHPKPPTSGARRVGHEHKTSIWVFSKLKRHPGHSRVIPRRSTEIA